MRSAGTISGDQPRVTQRDLKREDAPASLQYRVTSMRSLDNNRSTRSMGREGRR